VSQVRHHSGCNRTSSGVPGREVRGRRFLQAPIGSRWLPVPHLIHLIHFLGERNRFPIPVGRGCGLRQTKGVTGADIHERQIVRRTLQSDVSVQPAGAQPRGDVGIWHETYIIKTGHYETVYSGMPPFGLGKVGNLVAATGKREAARWRAVPVRASHARSRLQQIEKVRDEPPRPDFLISQGRRSSHDRY
jgi:hypothetical protein